MNTTTTNNTNFTLKFGKYKGQQFNQTPKFYQDWLLKQDWFKFPTDQLQVAKDPLQGAKDIASYILAQKTNCKYDIVRKFVKEYAIGMGLKCEIEESGLSWEVAEEKKNLLNLYHIDDVTDYYYINKSITSKTI
jgi:uncharacterized protein (DUF3820 family)